MQNDEASVVKDLQALSIRRSSSAIEGQEEVVNRDTATAEMQERIVLPPEVTDAQDALDWICDQKRLTLPILQHCRTLPGIQVLELEDEDASFLTALERVEGSQDPHWPDLDTVILRNMPLEESHMQILSKLPNISSLTLQNADLDMLHVGHLLPLGASLQSLDLSYNTSIDDSCLPITAFLPFLNQINLDRTSITMKGLRTFASVALPLRRLPYTQLIVPQDCREYLLQAKESKFYAFRIEEPYLIIKSADAVSDLNDSNVYENLRFHSRATGKTLYTDDPNKNRVILSDLLRERTADLEVLNFVNLDAQQMASPSVDPVADGKDAEVGREKSQVEESSDGITGTAPDQAQDS